MKMTDNYDYRGLVNTIVLRNIELCGNRSDWVTMAFALSDLGENGRELFHSLSSVSSNYSKIDSDKKFNDALRHNKRIHIGTLIKKAKDRGIDTNKFWINDESEKTKLTVQVQKKAPEPKKPPYYIPFDYVKKSFSEKSIFVNWLFDLFYKFGSDRKEIVRQALRNYWIGATKDGSVIFWKIDTQFRVTSGKVILYQTNGHRSKEKYATKDIHTNFLERTGEFDKTVYDRPYLCYFGEHLLNLKGNENKTVGIVESEKTALICSILYSDFVWLATSSLSNLTVERSQVLKGRNVIIYPDINGYKEWSEKAELLKAICNKVCVSQYLKNYLENQDETTNTKEEIAQKQKDIADKIDISDLLIRNLEIDGTTNKIKEEETKRIYSEILNKHPYFQTFANKLKLEIVV